MEPDFVPHGERFQPDSVGYYATIVGFSALFLVTGTATLIDRSNVVVWLFVAATSGVVALALTSARLTVAPDRVVVFCLGISREFPVTQIDRERFNDVIGVFHLSLVDGSFVLIPRAAFASTAPFSAIERVSAVAAGSNPNAGRKG